MPRRLASRVARPRASRRRPSSARRPTNGISAGSIAAAVVPAFATAASTGRDARAGCERALAPRRLERFAGSDAELLAQDAAAGLGLGLGIAQPPDGEQRPDHGRVGAFGERVDRHPGSRPAQRLLRAALVERRQARVQAAAQR